MLLGRAAENIWSVSAREGSSDARCKFRDPAKMIGTNDKQKAVVLQRMNE